MSKQYKNSPITEAVCEFQFGRDSAWDLTMPGLVFTKLKKTFPTRRQLQQVAFAIPIRDKVPAGILKPADQVQFLRTDEKALVQLAPWTLSIHMLRPYSSWENFVPLIELALGAYRKGAAPKSLRRVGLRYINRLEIPRETLELADYFEFAPSIGSRLPQEHGSFHIGVDFPHQEHRDNLKIQLGTTPAERPGGLAFLLDLDYFVVRAGEVSFADVSDWVEIAHAHIEHAFEGCIKDTVREVLDQEEG